MLAIRGFSKRNFITVGELALKLKIEPHSAAGLVARMETEGLVTKAADPDDKRRVLIRTTPRGDRALRHLSTAHKAELARVGPALKKILTHLEIIS